ncbi:hypothetical protein F5Y14DRAFT_450427 [Nemania sp. NC0429]|nr:hypothetical protein F5Y14DRAFT_450427 [Nemania sp. NC0429]
MAASDASSSKGSHEESAQRRRSGSDDLRVTSSHSGTRDQNQARNRSRSHTTDGAEKESHTDSRPASEIEERVNIPEFGLRGDFDNSHCTYDVVLIHGIRDFQDLVWTHKDGSNWVRENLFSNHSIRLLEFRYDISDAAPIFSAGGIEIEAIKLLDCLVKIRKNARGDPLIFVARDVGGKGTPDEFYSPLRQFAMLIPEEYPYN